MVKHQASWFYTLCTVLAFFCEISQARKRGDPVLKTKVYYSPEFVMQPGSAVDRWYFDIDFPRNHIGIKDLNAEIVDDAGVSIPLHENYLHHWLFYRYYQRIGPPGTPLNDSNYKPGGNSGLCHRLRQQFGLGSETRKTDSYFPDPYAVQIGNPAEIPAGYEEKWLIDVHVIDTRNVVDKSGCIECKCSLYNVTIDKFGKPIPPDYEGGLRCCHDNARCKVKAGFENSPRRLFLRYTVKWLDWDESFIPVRLYIFDVTDTLKLSEDSSTGRHSCMVEYDVEACKPSVLSTEMCIENRRLTFSMPEGQGGYVVFGYGHMHLGGISISLYRENGEVICPSIPIYGNGNEAGNEDGYIVGMTSCYPTPGSKRILDGETLVLESVYNNSRKHTGVMGFFYLTVADRFPALPPKKSFLDAVISKVDGIHCPISTWIMLVTGIVAVAIFAAAGFRRRDQVDDGYEPVLM